jgi:hypothetical protein
MSFPMPCLPIAIPTVNRADPLGRAIESVRAPSLTLPAIHDPQRWSSLARLACSLNKTLTGDWIAYYLVRNEPPPLLPVDIPDRFPQNLLQ